MHSDNLDNEFGSYEAECQGCDCITRVNDLGLCEECDAKLDRDQIREREWDYSASAFGVADKLEELRAKTIKKYGKKLELIAPNKSNVAKSANRKKNSPKKK
jgi:hypothetical protein